jgi:hypothetical protein
MLKMLGLASTALGRASQRALSTLQISARDVTETQNELDAFFGAEHGPSEEHTPFQSSEGHPSRDTAALRPSYQQGCGAAVSSFSHRESAALTHVDHEGRASMVNVGQVRSSKYILVSWFHTNNAVSDTLAQVTYCVFGTSGLSQVQAVTCALAPLQLW